MERFELRLSDAKRAANKLKEILDEPYSIITKDATIQRFEYTFEALWKLLKAYLNVHEGMICNSPKSCFRDAFAAGLLSEESSVRFLEMTDDRNMTSHTYREEVSQAIFSKISDYYRLIETLLVTIEMHVKTTSEHKKERN